MQFFHSMRICFFSSIGAAILLTLISNGASSQGHSGFLVTPNIDDLCKNVKPATHRSTVIYVDLGSISKDRTDWGLTILNRLELGPREPLTILGVNPGSFEISLVLDSCYPTLTKKEADSVRASRGITDKLFTLDPMDQQSANLKTFDARLRNSLDALIVKSAGVEPGKRRNVLGAIAFDSRRFTDRNVLYRVIIHTDGKLSDPLLVAGSTEAQQVGFLRENYSANLMGADISVFGVSGANEKDGSLESREKVFSAFFLNSWARLKSFSSSLPVQHNDSLEPVTHMEGSFSGGGAEGTAHLTFTFAKDGVFAQGWIVFKVARTTLYLPFEGEYGCSGDDCKLTATALEEVPPLSSKTYFRKGDYLLLQGKKDGTFEGTIQAPNEKFKDDAQPAKPDAQPAKYALKFPKP